MAPIRVGLIGLSTTSASTNWAGVAHLPYLQQTSKYEIVAICNSSVESAKKSIEHYKLPENTKAYGDPEDLAKDTNVELVVCATSVEHHYEVLVPQIKAGKNIFTELPLGQDITKSRHLAALAKEHKIRTVFGTQGQANPAVNIVKKIIEEGKIGKVLSTSVVSSATFYGASPISSGVKYFIEASRGANIMTIIFLHSMNFVLHALGEIESMSSMLDILRPEIGVFDPSDPDKKIKEVVKTDVPDIVLLQGRLESGAAITYRLDGGDPFPGEPGLRWRIVGEKGELLITAPFALIDIVHAGTTIKLFESKVKQAVVGEPLEKITGGGEKNEPVDIEIPKDDLSKVGGRAENVGRIYEAYADGKTDMYADWELGLKRHELIEQIFQQWHSGEPHGKKVEYNNEF